MDRKEEIIMKTIVLRSRKSSLLNIAIRKGEDLRCGVLEMERAVKKCIRE